jgi:hypothetical protein
VLLQGYQRREQVNKELIEMIEAWLGDPELNGQDASTSLSDLVSHIPQEWEVEFSLKGFLALIKVKNNE